MKTKKALSFYLDLYRQQYYFLKDWTREQVEKTLGIDTGVCGGITCHKEGIIYIWVSDIYSDEGVSELTHESIHAANFTLKNVGIKISVKNDEAQTYLSQWIFNHCYQSVKRKLKGG